MRAAESWRLGELVVRNRLLLAPVKTGYGNTDGEVMLRHLAYYHRRSEGGVGAVISEPIFVLPRGKEHPKQLGAHRDENVSGLEKLVEAIHVGGAAAIAHINHAGRAANPKAAQAVPVAPSPIPCPTTGATPEELTREGIEEILVAYREAARRVVEAGFDAIELQFGLGYLVAQFWSPRTNLREDEWGGDEAGRQKFARELLKAVREGAGRKTPLLVRLSATEQVAGGLELRDAEAMLAFLENQRVHGVHVVSGSACDSPPWYYQHMALPGGRNMGWAAELKQKTALPVIVAGRMGDPEDIHMAFDGAGLDGVALGRPLVADPDLPAKLLAGEDERVVRCGYCLQGCLLKVKAGEGLTCNVNPEAGREWQQQAEANPPKRIVVIGGGPAGMELALRSARRGHDVILLERSDQLGGQANLAGLAPGKEAMVPSFAHYPRALAEAGVEVRLNTAADRQTVETLQPDEVVLATGSRPVELEIPGLAHPLTGEEVQTGAKAVGRRVLVVGGGLVGLETADFLGERGHEVVVVELLDELARDMDPISRKLTLKRLAGMEVRLLTGTRLKQVREGRAIAERVGVEEDLGVFDSVVVAVGARPVNELAEHLQGGPYNLHTIGDAAGPGQIVDATAQAWELAQKL